MLLAVILMKSIELKVKYAQTNEWNYRRNRRLHWKYLVKLNLCLLYDELFPDTY